jgi:hypothetical protein
MHFPVFSLISCSKKGFGGKMGIISVPVRVIFKDKPDLSRIFLDEFFYGRTGRCAMGSLEVQEFYYGNRCIFGPELRRVSERNVITFFSRNSQRRKNKN